MPQQPDGRQPSRAEAAIDPDVDLRDRAERDETRRREWDVVLAVSAGGVVGAEARYGLSVAWPTAAPHFPWTTLVVNVTGCLLMGVLMALLQRGRPRRLVRPFVGVGVLGGYTTFSTFSVDTDRLVHAGDVATAAGYVVASVLGCLAAVALGTWLTRRLAPGVRT